ncbi:MAG: hypothetical protein GY765_40935, partial [bacterium]|nr:hypothetical protein [bacterium]
MYRLSAWSTLSYDLWRTDGTEGGTIRLTASLQWGSRSFIVLNDTVLFETYHGDFQFWTSDGTVEGTSVFSELTAGHEPSEVSGITNVNGTLYFAANDGTHGQELWKLETGETEPACDCALPTTDAGPDQTVDEGTVAALAGSVSGEFVSGEWRQTGGPTVELSVLDDFRSTFAAPEVDTDTALTFRFEAENACESWASDDVIVTVESVASNDDDAPVNPDDDTPTNPDENTDDDSDNGL